MSSVDLVAITFGLVWAVVTYILLKQNKSKPELWSRILGFGIGVYAFLSLMAESMLRSPKSEFLNYTAANLLWSLPLGLIGYFTGQAYARSRDKKK